MGFIKFSVIFLNLIIHQEVPKLEVFTQQEFRGLDEKTSAQQSQGSAVGSTGFQDPQAAATSGS